MAKSAKFNKIKICGHLGCSGEVISWESETSNGEMCKQCGWGWGDMNLPTLKRGKMKKKEKVWCKKCGGYDYKGQKHRCPTPIS